MKLTFNDVGNLYKWLSGPMHGDELRSRTQFINLIETKKNEGEEKRVTLLEEYADKDEAGKAIIENGMYKIGVENQVSYIKEFGEFLNGDTGLEVEKKLAKAIYNILKKSTKDMDIEQGKEYDKLMSAFEAI